MIPIGLKPGILVGVLLAGAIAAPADIEGHYIMIGSAVSIFTAVAVSAWNLSSKFRRIMDQLETSQKDRNAIHQSLTRSEEDTQKFRDKVEARLLAIDVRMAGLPCAKGTICEKKT